MKFWRIYKAFLKFLKRNSYAHHMCHTLVMRKLCATWRFSRDLEGLAEVHKSTGANERSSIFAKLSIVVSLQKLSKAISFSSMQFRYYLFHTTVNKYCRKIEDLQKKSNLTKWGECLLCLDEQSFMVFFSNHCGLYF